MSLIEEIRRQFDRVYETSRKRQRVYGRLGRLNADGSYTVRVPSDERMVYVRTDEQQAATVAFHRNAVNFDFPGLPVEMYREDGYLFILGYNAGQVDAFLGGAPYVPVAVDDVAAAIQAAPPKGTPGIYDLIGIVDSEDSNHLKKLSWVNLVNTLTGIFNTIYAALVHDHTAAEVTSGTFDNARIAQSNVTQHQGAIDHDSIANTHNLTTDIDHNTIANAHNLTTDINHNDVAGLQGGSAGERYHLTGAQRDAIAGLPLSLGDLVDVLLSTPANGHVLMYDDGEWYNVPQSAIDHNALTNTHNLTTDITHNSISGLTTGDPHNQYVFLSGRSGGQNLRGGTAANNNLTLESTSHGTKGHVVVQPNGGRMGLGNASPAALLDLNSQGGSPSGSPGHGIRVTQGAGTPGVIAERTDSSAFISFWSGANGAVFAFSETMFRMAFGTYSYADRYSTNFPTFEIMSMLPNGRIGFDKTDPTMKLQATLEQGGGWGVRSVSLTSTGTWINILPAGSVLGVLNLRASIRPSSGAVGVTQQTMLPGAGTVTIYNVGGNTVLAEVTAGGIFRVQRSAGSATFVVAVDLLWI